MTISRTTTFPATPTFPGGNSVTVTGNTGTELKNNEIAQLQTRLSAQNSGSAVLQGAIDALNT
jgi:hypothetical protein